MPHLLRSIRPPRLRDSLNKSGRALMLFAAFLVLSYLFGAQSVAQKKRAGGGRVAVVVDERLAALRDAPDFAANILQRMSRGRTVTVLGAKKASDGVMFYRVSVTRRTSGWLQSDAIIRPANDGDDERLLRLIKGSQGFDRIERAGIFLEMFPRSPLRPAALSILGAAAEAEAANLTRAAQRRLDAREIEAGGAPVHTYFLNYNGLDRFRRQGVVFTFDTATKQFHYDGSAWREILRRHPGSPEAVEARQRLKLLSGVVRR